MTKGIRLNPAWLSGARHTHSFRPLRKGPGNKLHLATQHRLGTSAMFHVGKDAVAISDGSWGYMPFSISGLRELLDEVERQPVVHEFRTDS